MVRTSEWHLAVQRELMRRGIGKALVERGLRQSGAALLIAETDGENAGFYRRIGCVVQSLGEKYPGVERFLCELRPYFSRAAVEGDFEVIARWPQSRQEAFFLFPSGSWPLDGNQLLEKARSRHFPTLLLDATGEPAAYANCYENEGQLWLGNVVVNPVFRGKGAAQALMLELCRLARERNGAQELHLICHNLNTRALLLYSGLGWEPYGVKRMQGPEGLPLAGIRMRRRLRAGMGL
ncbi:GNAT family N-acetyltransferase [Paenibacillus herberti]|uniref:N-acetyltransferase domain-containing protein n=1 Tax=Paenibacillus herberti TaxID=1619309 RepID=A0A229P1F8_9BACL|nr:GNAT family N-acetyltransferase [Paenibacillus herberti]OXM15871.1 hypothetical protein CGZ75_03910 [Paenibacillus herberti]